MNCFSIGLLKLVTQGCCLPREKSLNTRTDSIESGSHTFLVECKQHCLHRGVIMNKIIFCIGIAGMLGLSTIFTITFFIAYFQPSQSLTITVNDFGEANIEFLVFMLLLPINFYVAIHLIRLKRMEMGHRRKNPFN